MTRNKKCQPLKCSRFAKRFESVVENRDLRVRSYPVDRIVIGCQFRVEGNMCINKQEKLEKTLVK